MRLLRNDRRPGFAVHRAIRRSAAGSSGPDSVFHLLRPDLVEAAARIQFCFFRAPTRGTWVLLRGLLPRGGRRSSMPPQTKAYGPSRALPYREETRLKPAAPASQQAAADVISRNTGPPSTCRSGDPPGQRLRQGSEQSRLCPVATACLAGRLRHRPAPAASPERDYHRMSAAAAWRLKVR